MAKKKKVIKKPAKKVITKAKVQKRKRVVTPIKKATKGKGRAKPVNKKPIPAKKPVKKSATKKKVITPAKKLETVKKDLVKARQPIYSLNRKIKNAKNKNQERKFKREKKLLLAEVEPKIEKLVAKRKTLKKDVENYSINKKAKSKKTAKIKRLEKRLEKAVDDGDIEESESLRRQIIKADLEINKLDEELGLEVHKPDLESFNAEDYEDEGGEGFDLDLKSPYAIFQADRQLHEDLNSGGFKFFIINGKRFAGKNIISISVEASMFFSLANSTTGGTPYFNRYVNLDTDIVKWIQVFL